MDRSDLLVVLALQAPAALLILFTEGRQRPAFHALLLSILLAAVFVVIAVAAVADQD